MPGLFGRFSLLDVLVYVGVVALAIVLIRIFAPRYYDRAVAVSALALFGSFLLIIGIWVESISLRVVLLLAFAMATYDFWLDAFSRKNGNGS